LEPQGHGRVHENYHNHHNHYHHYHNYNYHYNDNHYNYHNHDHYNDSCNDDNDNDHQTDIHVRTANKPLHHDVIDIDHHNHLQHIYNHRMRCPQVFSFVKSLVYECC
jgi:hypothetical protein